MKESLFKYYNLHCTDVIQLDRLDDSNGNKIFKIVAENKNYFLKEIPAHSQREGLNEIYNELEKCHPLTFKMVLPLRTKDGSFLAEINGKEMMLYHFIEHEVFFEAEIGLKKILTMLDELFTQLKPLQIPTHEFKNYPGWLRRGLKQLKETVGQHPFFEMADEYLANRYNELSFLEGNTHFDLNPFNIWTNEEQELFVTDFDNAQVAAYAKDIFDCCSVYLKVTDAGADIEEKTLDEIYVFAKKYILNLEKRDVIFLLSRPLVRPMIDPHSKMTMDQMIRRLNYLLELYNRAF